VERGSIFMVGPGRH